MGWDLGRILTLSPGSGPPLKAVLRTASLITREYPSVGEYYGLGTFPRPSATEKVQSNSSCVGASWLHFVG